MKKLICIFVISAFIAASCVPAPQIKKTEFKKEQPVPQQVEPAYKNALEEFQKGNYSKSLSILKDLSFKYHKDFNHPKIAYLMIENYFFLNKFDHTVTLCNKFLADFDYPQYKRNIYLILAQSYHELNQLSKAYKYYSQGLEYDFSKPEKTQIENKFLQLLKNNAPSTENLYALKEKNLSSNISEYIDYIIIKRLFENCELQESKIEITKFKSEYSSSSYINELENILSEINYRLENNLSCDINIAVIAPFTGKNEAFGEQLKRGVQIAENVFSERNPRVKINTIFKDNKSDILQTVFTAKELLKEKRADFIIGSIYSEETIALAAFLDNKKTPLIAPTATQEGINKINDFTFTLNSSYVLQANEIAKFACDSLGYTRFAILHPASERGTRMAKEFYDTVISKGGEIISMDKYYSDHLDVTDIMKKYEKIEPEAVFLPGESDELITLTPLFKYHNIFTHILGGSNWNSKKVLRMGNHFDRVIFAENYFPESKYEHAEILKNRYYDIYKTETSQIAALGYDAFMIAAQSVINDPSPEAAAKYINEKISNYPGASGLISDFQDNYAERNLYILGIDNKKIIQISDNAENIELVKEWKDLIQLEKFEYIQSLKEDSLANIDSLDFEFKKDE